jgi:hypothetical protein
LRRFFAPQPFIFPSPSFELRVVAIDLPLLFIPPAPLTHELITDERAGN